MIISITFLYFVASTCNAKPSSIELQNVVTVPANCPDGQEWVNGQCRDIWRVTAAPANVVTVPPNCGPGQEYVNGQCRDIWIKSLGEQNNLEAIQSNYETANMVPQNLVTVPPNCSPGQQWINGACRDVWRSDSNTKNVIQVPNNCPNGQEYVNGQCREIWRSASNMENFINNLQNILTRNERQVENAEELEEPDQDATNRNVISVPNQCPAGYRPDALGVCREIF